jgi:membrane protein DedA with SNARE-associated domain
MSKLFYQSVLIFLMGAAGMWKAVPFGFVLKAPPLVIFLMSAAGSMAGVLVLYFFGKQIKKIFKRKSKLVVKQAKANRARKLFDKYGVPGLGFFGTFLIGPNLTIVIGVTIVKATKQLLYWVLASTVFWSFILSLTGYYSIELFQEIASRVKFF